MKRLTAMVAGGFVAVALAAAPAWAEGGCGGLKSAHTEKPAQTAGAPETPAPTETKPQG